MPPVDKCDCVLVCSDCNNTLFCSVGADYVVDSGVLSSVMASLMFITEPEIITGGCKIGALMLDHRYVVPYLQLCVHVCVLLMQLWWRVWHLLHHLWVRIYCL